MIETPFFRDDYTFPQIDPPVWTVPSDEDINPLFPDLKTTPEGFLIFD